MPNYTAKKQADHLRKFHPTVPMYNYVTMVIPSTAADTTESIELMDVPPGWTVTGLIWNISATLGASCAIQARVGTTAISAASTAGGADTEVQTAYAAPSTSAQALNWLVSGGDTSASATLTAGFFLTPAQTVSLG